MSASDSQECGVLVIEMFDVGILDGVGDFFLQRLVHSFYIIINEAFIIVLLF